MEIACSRRRGDADGAGSSAGQTKRPRSPLGVERQPEAVGQRILNQVTRARENTKRSPRTDLGRAPPAPGSASPFMPRRMSVRRPRATRARPAGPGSSLPQHVEHALQRGPVESRSDTDAAVAATSISMCGKTLAPASPRLGRDRHRHQRRLATRPPRESDGAKRRPGWHWTSYCRATTETDAPGRDVAATIRA